MLGDRQAEGEVLPRYVDPEIGGSSGGKCRCSGAGALALWEWGWYFWEPWRWRPADQGEILRGRCRRRCLREQTLRRTA